jgi:uncharacterized protein (DUF433 family)
MGEALPADKLISHYRIISQLGAGGMGEVYLAEDTRLKRTVALKLLPAQFTQDATGCGASCERARMACYNDGISQGEKSRPPKGEKAMSQEYVEKVNGFYRIAGTRVSLDSLVYAFRDGDTAETIARSFPVLTLEQVYGAIAWYLAHRAEVDEHLLLEEADFEEKRRLSRIQNADLYERLQAARRSSPSPPQSGDESTLPG